MTAVLTIIFFLSGASALIYEALWFRLAGITFGNSVWASSIVLAGFMGGMALGNWFVALRGDKIKTPIRFYAIIEVVIAISGISLVFLFPYFTELFAPVFRPFLDNPIILNGMRAVLSIGLLLVPATAMGATLPLLVKALYKERAEFNRVLGLLYGFNTLGAVAGVLSVEPIWVKHFGINGAGIAAAAINLLTALAAYTLSKYIGETTSNAKGWAEKIKLGKLSANARNFLIAGFLSGFLLLALEVIWFRFLLLFFTSSSWIFSVMLAVILLGISLGGIIAAHVFKKRDRHINILFLLFIFNGLLVSTLYSNFDWFLGLLGRWQSLGWNYHTLIGLAALFLMLPVSLISGILFTLLGSALHEELQLEAGASGLLILSNTLGGMMGALMGGALCIPFLGVELSFVLMSTLYGLTAFFTIGRSALQQKKLKMPYFAGLGVIFLLFLSIFPFGLMQKYYLNLPIARFLGSGYSRVAEKEGINETIQYLKKDLVGMPYSYMLMTNNHAMSGVDVRSKRYMKMFVYWPVALQDKPETALLICFGCGSTAKALTNTKSLEKIDIVDISKDVVEMSHVVFPDKAENPIYDPRVEVHIEDGRFYLQTTETRYDIITAEPPPPKHAGIVNLYSQEYFQLIYDQLKPGGIVTYWLPVYQMEATESKSILKGFANVFSNCSLWSGAGLEWMMVGIKPPLKQAKVDQFDLQWKDSVTGSEMRNLGLNAPTDFSSLFIADGVRLKDWIKEAPPLTDNYPQRLSLKPTPQHIEAPYFQLREPASVYANFLQSPQMKSIWPPAYLTQSKPLFQMGYQVDKVFQTTSKRNNLFKIKRLHQFINDPILVDYTGFVLAGYNYNFEIIENILKTKNIKPSNYLNWYQKINQQILETKNYRQVGDIIILADHFALQAIGRRAFLEAENYYRIAWNMMKQLSEGNYNGDNLILLRMYLLSVGGRYAEAMELSQGYIDYSEAGKPDRTQKIQEFINWYTTQIKSKQQIYSQTPFY